MIGQPGSKLKIHLSGYINGQKIKLSQVKWAKVFNIKGALVKDFTRGEIDEALNTERTLTWDCKKHGQFIASGLYFVVVESSQGRSVLSIYIVK